MSVVNLNKARKSRAKAGKVAQAEVNAVKFGRSKAERSLVEAKAKLAAKRLDETRLE